MIYQYITSKYSINTFLLILFFLGGNGYAYANNLSFVPYTNEKPECLTVTILQDQIKYSCPQQNNGKLNIKIKGGEAPYFVIWEDNRGNVGGPLIAQDSLAEIPNLAPRPYTIEVFDSGTGSERCFSGIQGPINMENAQFEVTTDLIALPQCYGDANGQVKAIVNLNGVLMEEVTGFQFIWQSATEDTVATQNQAINLSKGDYQLTAFTNNGCIASSSIDIPEPSPLQIEDRQISPAYCSNSENGSIQINNITGGTGEQTIIWQDYPDVTSTLLDNLKPATYHFTIKDDNNCSLVDSATIITQMELAVDLVQDQTQLSTSCHHTEDAKVTIAINDNLPADIATKVTEPYQFDWSANAGLVENDFDKTTISALAADTFEVRVTNPDLPGCLATFGVQTISPASLKVDTTNFMIATPNCATPFSGTAALRVQGGTPNYHFDWSDGGEGRERSDLAAQTYQVTISDENNCELLQELTIPSPDSLQLSIASVQDESCLGTKDGEIRVTANKSATELVYFWQPNISNDSIGTQLGNGTYIVEAEDENGCSDIISVSIEALINQVNQPILANDEYNFDFYATKQFKVLANDDLSNQPIILNIVDNPNPEIIKIDQQNTIHVAPTNFYYDELDFSYEVCLEACPVICSTAKVKVELEGQDFFPSGFTPNGDGINDELVFPQLTNDFASSWPNNELIVFNRWGSIVYQAKPYLNDWGGQNPKNGKPLPAGTYFYIIRLDIGNGKVKQRELTILR